jgi:glycosyltransferase involved in cell wall biosynthesis
MRVTDRLAHGIVVNSLAVKNSLVREDAVPLSRIHLCYNGIDLDRFHSHRPAPPPGSPVVIAFAGVLRPEKDLGTLLQAVALLQPPEREVRLRLIGSGPMADSLKNQSCALGLDGICSFDSAAGRVEDALRTVDIFVLPSLSESFSNSLMEAMACGCAVVASRAGGNPELVDHGRTGLLFEAGNSSDLAASLRPLIQDASLRERFGRDAAEAIRARFSLADSAAAMGRIYESFLAGANEPRP